MSKRIMSLVLIFAMILGVFSFVSAETDYSNHWAKKQIQYLVDEGVINGYPDGSFRPNRDVTRAEFMTMVNEALGLTKKGTVSFFDYYLPSSYNKGKRAVVLYEHNSSPTG